MDKKNLFSKPKNKVLAAAISIRTPKEFRKSIKTVKELDYIGKRERKKALVLAQTRAKIQLKRKGLSSKEKREFKNIVKIKLPKVSDL